MFNNLLTYGDLIELKLDCNSKKLLEEIKDFEWKRYNPRKDINRYGLSITSEDGSLNGKDLDSLAELTKETGTIYDEDSFTKLTDVYYKSKEVQKLIEPFKPWLCRTHFLNFRKGGYFPPHIDNRLVDKTKFIRILVPIKKIKPSYLYFIHDGNILNFNRGSAYFLNTNKQHCIFSFNDDCIMLVMNLKATDDCIRKVFDLMRWK